MSLPKQVRQQIAEAQRIEGEIRAAAATPPADPAVAPQPSPAPQPAAAAPTPPSPAPAPAAATDPKYEELVQQYRSLQGIHRTLVRTNGEQQSKMQGMQAQLNELSTEIGTLRTAAAAAPSPAATIAPITPEEIKEFGPDLINVIERKAMEIAAPLNQALRDSNTKMEALAARNAELERQLVGVTQVQAQTANQNFETRLRALVPDIDVLNFNAQFLAWLSQADPLDARKRTLQQRLDEAVQLGDAEAAASYFAAYKSLVKAATPQPNPNLAAQAQPASRAAPDSANQPTGKTWTQAEIASFYDGVTRGRYSPQEKARIEGEIYKAQRENRIAA